MTAVARVTLPDARHDRLFFAQVREDPLLELAALRPGADDHVMVVSSGGCTALSLLAAGAGRVTAVDLNATQNHLVELKAQAVASLGGRAATAFLGGAPDPRRLERWPGVRDRLGAAARRYWSERRRQVRDGVLRCGTSERFIAVVIGAMRRLVHPPARVRRLLACRSLEEQRALYEREWDSRRWRLLFRLLLNRWTFDRAYHPAFFAHVSRPSFAAYFHEAVGRGLTELPVRTNYFLHQMLGGHYPAGDDAALPPYLTAAGAAAVGGRLGGLTLVDGGVGTWLRGQPARSVHGFALSNVCEWMSATEVDALFAEIARTAAPGARVAFRNFVGWTEVPERWRSTFVEDGALGDRLGRQDRSLLQRRIVCCTVAAPRAADRTGAERLAVAGAAS